jgi:hypothetical protein
MKGAAQVVQWFTARVTYRETVLDGRGDEHRVAESPRAVSPRIARFGLQAQRVCVFTDRFREK